MARKTSTGGVKKPPRPLRVVDTHERLEAIHKRATGSAIAGG